MMNSVQRWIIPLLLAALIMTDCTPRAKYNRMLKRELASGMRNDSLFMGLYLGMPKKDFYTHCWELNKKGLIRQGSNNTSVEYNTKDELKYPAVMNFYPKFTDDKISEMPIIFSYKGWAPWNKALSSRSLQQDILQWYQKVYGGGFMIVSHREFGDAYVKINGNRRISIFTKDDLHVWVLFTDLFARQDSAGSPVPETAGKDTILTRENK